MFHMLEVLELSVRAFSVHDCLERPRQFLHRNLHALLRVVRSAGGSRIRNVTDTVTPASLPNGPVGASSDGAELLVADGNLPGCLG